MIAVIIRGDVVVSTSFYILDLCVSYFLET
jgi:hypothetical protein